MDDPPRRRWLPHYSLSYLPGDLIAGLTVAIMLVPQSMAYALLAGLPPVVGLYAGVLPVMVYGLLGTTRILTLGPTAITSVMVLASINNLAPQGTDAYLTLSLTLTLLLGGLYILMGVLRLGWIVNLLSQPVLVGYVNAAALTIIFSQLQNILGINAPRASSPIALVVNVVERLQQTNFVTLVIGLGCIGLLFYFRRYLGGHLRRLPEIVRLSITRSGPLVVVLLAILLVAVLRLDESAGVRIIGEIPAGLPQLAVPALDTTHLDSLLLGAVAIAFVGFMEGISTAKSLVSQRRQRLDANQEMLAMGAANIASAFSGGYAVTTSISRSAVNHAAGANTGLSSLIAGSVLALVVTFFTPVFYYLPSAALAAIIIMSVVNLISFKSIWELWRYNRLETLPFLVTFVAVFTTRIEVGILAGVGAAAALHLWRTSRLELRELGRAGYSEHYRERAGDEMVAIPGVLILRVDESLYFANAQYLDKQLRNEIAEHQDTTHLILVCSAINSIDASALQIMAALIEEFREAGIEVYLAELKESVLDRLERVQFVEQVGRGRFFPTTHAAVQATGQLLDSELPL